MNGFKVNILNFILKLRGSSPLGMARYASAHTKFYNRLYTGFSLDNFEDLPVVSKYDLTGVSPYDLLSDEFRDRVYIYGETSGSSGSPTPAFFTRKDFEGLVSLSLLSPYASSLKEAARENRMAVNGLTFGFTIAGFTFGAILQKAGFTVAQLGARSTIATPERMARTIVKLKPSAISATPLDFMSWMKITKADFPDDYEDVVGNIRFLLSTAEPCARSRQNRIEELFDLTHINTYASVDGFVSLQCPCGEMHLIDNLLKIELFDGDMNPLGPFGKGRLCFTNLLRRSTPMVRYLLDDLVTVKRSDCKHGYRKSIYPHGRYELSVDINDRTMGNLDFEEIIYRHGLFMNYGIEIKEDEVNINLEEYDIKNNDNNLYGPSGIKDEVEAATGLRCRLNMVPLGELTPYRMVRSAKSVIKVVDMRNASRQDLPIVL